MAVESFREGSNEKKNGPSPTEWNLGAILGAPKEKEPGPKKKKSRREGHKDEVSGAQVRGALGGTDGSEKREPKGRVGKDKAVAFGDFIVRQGTEKKPVWIPKREVDEEKKPGSISGERPGATAPGGAGRPDGFAERNADEESREKPVEAADHVATTPEGEPGERLEDEHDKKEAAQGYDKEAWPAQGFVLPLDEVYGGESYLTLSLDGAEPPHPEKGEEGTKPDVEETEPKPIPESLPMAPLEDMQDAPPGPAVISPEAARDIALHEQPIQRRYGYEAAAMPVPAAVEAHPDLHDLVAVSPGTGASAAETLWVPAEDKGFEPLEPSGEPTSSRVELTDDIPELAAAFPYTNPAEGAWDPAAAYRRYNEREQGVRREYDANNQLVTKRELDDAVYSTARVHQARGLVAGVVLGGAIEHFRHRRREKKEAKFLKRQTKALVELRKTHEDQHFYFTEQAAQRAEDARRIEAATQRADRAEKRLHVQKVSERQPAERPVGLRQAEATQQPAEAVRVPEITKAPALEAPELLAIPREHVLQSSAWHSIEIDKRTGLPVENPAFAYGQEYYHERAPETRAADRRSAVAGEVALVAAAHATSGVNDASAQGERGPVPATAIPSATRQGPPPATQRAKATANNFRDQIRGSSAGGPLWPYLVALVVILFCLVVLLR
jgi:hypothetical protein